MSVQAGIWNFDGRPVDRKLLENLSDSLRQQGPDGESCYVDGSVALLYRPFHTTAESRQEKQPYTSRRGFILTWDGRLDNREVLIAELRSELDASPTDVAIFAAAFDRWDTDCFRRIVGDWAVSIWKPEQRELLFAADYMAIRHIFYYLKNDRIWWSTDLSPLVLLSGDKFHIDDDYIAGYFAHDPEAHLTPYREIREVPPGQFVRIRNGRRRRSNATGDSVQSREFATRPTRNTKSTSAICSGNQCGAGCVQTRRSSLNSAADSTLLQSSVWPTTSLPTKESRSLVSTRSLTTTTPSRMEMTRFTSRGSSRSVEESASTLTAARLGSSPASLECSEFCPLPGALGAGRESWRRARCRCAPRRLPGGAVGYWRRRVHGRGSRSSRALGRSHRAVQARQPRQTAHGLELGQTQAVDSTSLAVGNRSAACLPGPILGQGG